MSGNKVIVAMLFTTFAQISNAHILQLNVINYCELVWIIHTYVESYFWFRNYVHYQCPKSSEKFTHTPL